MPSQLADYDFEDKNHISGSVDWKETFKQHKAPDEESGVESVTSGHFDDENASIELDLSKVPLKFLELSITTKTKCDEVDALRRAKADRYVISLENEKLLELKRQYYETVGKKFPVSADRIAFEFVYNYYDFVDNERTVATLLPYYQKDSAFNINSYAKFIGSANITKAILANFCDLAVDHTIKSVELDRHPPKRCAMYLKAYGTIKLQGDRQRHFMEIFELNYSNKNAFGASKYYISNQIFTITDTRPLYAWPAKEIQQTNFDNREIPLQEEIVSEKQIEKSFTGLAELSTVVSSAAKWMTKALGTTMGNIFSPSSSHKKSGEVGGAAEAKDDEDGKVEEEEEAEEKITNKQSDPVMTVVDPNLSPSFFQRVMQALSKITSPSRPSRQRRVSNRIHVVNRVQ